MSIPAPHPSSMATPSALSDVREPTSEGTCPFPHTTAEPIEPPMPSKPDTEAFLVAEAASYLTGPDAPHGSDSGRRMQLVSDQVAATGTYTHTSEELAHGAALAWRNHARCIGRLHWRSLKVNDARDAQTAGDVFDACVEHLRQATNGGDIQSMITVFGQEQRNGSQIRIWNSQLIRYAGYRMPDGNCIGDPMNADLTEAIQKVGWQGAGGPFDVLPLAIQMPDQQVELFELPKDAVLEVRLTHADLPWFADLGLRWHALPAISDMRMDLGGLSYTACPFNGWYVSFEIGARNFSDEHRYNMLPAIAEHMGLDTRTNRTLWKDRALLELNAAVLHSFTQAGVRIVDHHTAAKQFCKHTDRENAAGRVTPTDWAWVVPPISGSTTPTFHRTFENPHLRPNFYHQPPAWQ